MRGGLNYYSTEWAGPGAGSAARRRFRFFRAARSWIVPPKGQRTLPTLSGYVLLILVIGMMMAAYQASSNILFIAVSVLVAALVVSGIFLWLNTTRVSWRITTEPPFRAGDTARLRIEVRNRKKFFPSYALVFQVDAASGRPEGNRTVALRGPLAAGGTAILEPGVTYMRRGVNRVRVTMVRSAFPFGFLRKTMGGGEAMETVVWPRRIRYRQLSPAGGVRQFSGEPLMKSGNGSEFINLRTYRHGDSHRDIHWKATARLRNLVVRQRAAEAHSGYIVHLRTSIALWPDEERFELLCSFASSLAEDLFERGVLLGARIDEEPYIRVGRRSEFDYFQDSLATLGRLNDDRPVPALPGPAIVTFEPSSRKGIDAYIGGQRAATV